MYNVENPELESLVSVGGDLVFNGNHALTNIDGLDGLLEIGGGLSISGWDLVVFQNSAEGEPL